MSDSRTHGCLLVRHDPGIAALHESGVGALREALTTLGSARR
ncbi:hypothetical protein ACFXPA_03970 [Amycolatopsis sp. NPDC059090]